MDFSKIYMKDTKIVAVALIKNGEEKYLLVRLSNYYKECEKYHNSWCPVAGHIKKDETVERCLIREAKEELSLDIRPVKLISEWEQDIPGEKAVWWECLPLGEIIKRNDEIAEVGWFSKEEIKNMKLWPATRKFFEKFIWAQGD